MQSFDLYNDISVRTGGDIYIGVVGPVRTGKSTFIKRFMDLLVLPNIIDGYERERAQDELPHFRVQAAAAGEQRLDCRLVPRVGELLAAHHRHILGQATPVIARVVAVRSPRRGHCQVADAIRDTGIQDALCAADLDVLEFILRHALRRLDDGSQVDHCFDLVLAQDRLQIHCP